MYFNTDLYNIKATNSVQNYKDTAGNIAILKGVYLNV